MRLIGKSIVVIHYANLIKLNDSSPVLSQRDYWWGIPAARQLLVAPSIYIDWIPIWIPIRIGLDYGRI